LFRASGCGVWYLELWQWWCPPRCHLERKFGSSSYSALKLVYGAQRATLRLGTFHW
jgi:hypothetical protein